MTKSDYILAFLVSLIIGLWGLFCYYCLIALGQWRFTVLFFVLLIILLSIGILGN